MGRYIVKDGKRIYRKQKKYKGRCIPRARWVFQTYYKIELPSYIDVHHKNSDILDDRIENLEAVPHGYHTIRHHLGGGKYGVRVKGNELGYHRRWRKANANKLRRAALKWYYKNIERARASAYERSRKRRMLSMIRPTKNWILVKVGKVTEKSGIVLPDTAQKEEEVVEVLAIGEEVEKVAVGARVVAMPQSGQSIPINGTEAVFIKESDVIAIIEG